MPRLRALCSITLLCIAATSVAGCSRLFEDQNEGGWFSKKVDIFAKPDWAVSSNAKAVDLGPKGPVGPEELVNADGSCPPEPGQVTASADGANAQATATDAPPVLGGVALGMTECQVARRAGSPGNIAVSTDEKGERRVVLTYLSGPWPGIYTFNAGRLKVVERAPEPQKPAKPAPKKKQAAKRTS